MKTMQAAYDAAGFTTEYFQLYAPYNAFVHVTNPDWDFAEIVDGRPALKALNQRDPRSTLFLLTGTLTILMRILHAYLEDHEFSGYPEEIVVQTDSGDILNVGALTALQYRIAQVFGEWSNFPNPGRGTV